MDNLNGYHANTRIPKALGAIRGASAFSIACRVRIGTLSTWSRLFDLGSGTGTNLFLTPRSSAGTARFAITTSGAGGEQRIEAPAALPTGAWTHVAVTQTGNLGSTTQNWIGRSQYGGDPFLAAVSGSTAGR